MSPHTDIHGSLQTAGYRYSNQQCASETQTALNNSGGLMTGILQMTKAEQKQFLEELFRDTLADMLDALDKVPDTWNGMELRTWSAERMNRNVWGDYDMRKGKQSRARDYRNHVLVNNL
jgi:hypothetical protein